LIDRLLNNPFGYYPAVRVNKFFTLTEKRPLVLNFFSPRRKPEIHGKEIKEERREKGKTKFGLIQRKEKGIASRTSFNALRRDEEEESQRLNDLVTC
jgi:hypothetical protein